MIGPIALAALVGTLGWVVLAGGMSLAGEDGTGTAVGAGSLMLLTVRVPGRRLAERRYIVELILREWLGIDYRLETREGAGVTIGSGDGPGPVISVPDVLLATADEDWLTSRSMPALPLARVDSPTLDDSPAIQHLPVLYGTPGPDTVAWRRTADGIELDIDVLGSAFFVLSRYEEVVRPERDEHDRFPSATSIAVTEGFLGRPIVDEYVDLLWSAIHALWPSLRRRQTAYGLRPTHDVDHPWATIGEPTGAVVRATAGDLVRRRDPMLAVRRARAAVDARSGRVDRDPFHTFDALMAASERHGLRGLFYFLAGNEPGDHDYRYRSDDPIITRLLAEIHHRGHEIGLHASYESHVSRERIEFEFEALRRACRIAGFDQPDWGVRQHYLRLRHPDTWRHHESIGFAHDSTLGYSDAEGFRGGTGREYPLFDVLAGRQLRLRERPLLVMDTALFVHQSLDTATATSRVLAVVDAARRHHSEAVILYHNNHVSRTNVRRHFDDVVDALAAPGASARGPQASGPPPIARSPVRDPVVAERGDHGPTGSPTRR